MKKLHLPLLTLLVSVATTINAQNQQDIQAIKSMCGCYEVSFNFAETFSYGTDSLYKPSDVKHDRGLEWIELVTDKADELVLQHLLIVGRGDNQSVIKHWRQDWIYENTDFHMFVVDETWNKVIHTPEQVKGQWTQRVYQVDDSPRYQGSASWVHIDGKSYWENVTDAPLPRREYTKRNDYNVLVRQNRHEIVANGWIHEQDNKKVIRHDASLDTVLAEEKGYNTYVKVDDGRCRAAQDWWASNNKVWKNVRSAWDRIFEENSKLSLAVKVDGKRLFERLFELDSKSTKKEAYSVIQSFIESK